MCPHPSLLRDRVAEPCETHAVPEFDIVVRVKPGSSRTRVGGSWDGPRRPGDMPALIVTVTAKAVEGAATEAVVSAVAQAFGLSRRDVEVVGGHVSRDKRIRLSVADIPAARRQLSALLESA